MELVRHLRTESFLRALKCFVTRRECPIEIYSNNHTNFVGANNEFNKVIRSLFKSKEEIGNYLANEAIKWHFNSSSTPHLGNLWEERVKSLKFHLCRVLGNTVL